MNRWLLMFVAMGGCTVALAQEWPAELKAAEAALADEGRFVTAVTDYYNTQRPQVAALIDEAKLARNQELAKKAVDSLSALRKGFELALSKFPDNPRLKTLYGELLYDFFAEPGTALKLWREALQQDPALAGAHNDLGMLLLHQGQYGEGLDHLEKALKLEPKNPNFLFNAAQIYLIHAPQIQGLKLMEPAAVYATAMAFSREAAALSPDDFELVSDYAVNFFAAERFRVTADWSKAAKTWQAARKAARKQDQVFYTWLNEARVSINGGKRNHAIKCLEEALKILPDSPVAKQLLEEQRKGKKSSKAKAAAKE